MRSSIRNMLAALAMAVGCALPGLAKAETITATLTGLNPYVFGSVHLDGAGTLGGGVGNIVWQGNSTNSAPFNGVFNSYCIDLLQDIGFGGSYTYTVGSLSTAPNPAAYPAGGPTNGMGSAKAKEIDTLYGMHYSDSLTANLGMEAFQLAIWNIVYDTDTSVSDGSGAFYAISNSGLDASAITTANSWLSDVANPQNQAQFAVNNVEALYGTNGAQDQVFLNPLIPASIIVESPVPLPGAGVGAAAMLGLVAIARWKRAAGMKSVAA